MEKMMSARQTKRCIVAFALFLMAAWPAMGQISNKAVKKHGELKRQSLKEASQTESTYKDTHLNMDAYTFKKGEFPRADGQAPAPLLRPAGAPDKETVQRKPAVREKKKFRLFRKKNQVN